MKIQFGGTGAAEGIPAIFCNCTICDIARKSLTERRRRSMLIINDELIIDFGPDLSTVCENNKINMMKMKCILITHTHFDHFYPHNLEIRSRRYQKNKPPEMIIVGDAKVSEKVNNLGYESSELCVEIVEIKPYERKYLFDYEIIAIPANHEVKNEIALNYIIIHKGVTLLYAIDTGIYTKEQFDAIFGLLIDVLILDGTNVFGGTSKNHLNLKGVNEMVSNFKSKGLFSEKPVVLLSHFSHTGILSQKLMEKILIKYNIIPAYDGKILFYDGGGK